MHFSSARIASRYDERGIPDASKVELSGTLWPFRNRFCSDVSFATADRLFLKTISNETICSKISEDW